MSGECCAERLLPERFIALHVLDRRLSAFAPHRLDIVPAPRSGIHVTGPVVRNRAERLRQFPLHKPAARDRQTIASLTQELPAALRPRKFLLPLTKGLRQSARNRHTVFGIPGERPDPRHESRDERLATLVAVGRSRTRNRLRLVFAEIGRPAGVQRMDPARRGIEIHELQDAGMGNE